MNNQEILNAIEKLKNNSIFIANRIDLEYISENSIMNNVDDLINEIEQYILETEIIYYETAMEFLAENDASLINSLELASDMGYSIENLSSETLATLLLQDLLIEELHNIL